MKIYLQIILAGIFLFVSCGKKEYDNHFSGWYVIHNSQDFLNYNYADYTEDENNNVYILTSSGHLLKSEDNGNEWQNMNIYLFRSGYSIAVNENANSYIVGNKGEVLYTKGKINNNTFWNHMTFDTNYANTQVIYCNNHYRIAACNNHTSKVYSKEISSSTWYYTIINAPYLRNIFFIDENNGWIYGDERIYYSNNNGANWHLQKELKDTVFTSLTFIDKNQGWASVSDGVIYHTTNSGNDWSPIYSNPEYVFLNLDFIDEKTGWAAGFKRNAEDFSTRGFILYTKDGGNTWTQHPFVVGSEVYKIHFSDKNHAYALGFDFLIYTETGGF